MIEFFVRLFRREPSGSTAKERLRLVLLSDHLSLAPELVAALKRDLIEVISRYVEVDREHCDVTFEQQERAVAMLANIPILRVPRNGPAPELPPRNGHINGTAVAETAPPAPAEAPSPAELPEPPATVAKEPAAEGPVANLQAAPPLEPPLTVAMLAPAPEVGATPPRRRRRRRRTLGTPPGAIVPRPAS